jgi:hypothetical protein
MVNYDAMFKHKFKHKNTQLVFGKCDIQVVRAPGKKTIFTSPFHMPSYPNERPVFSPDEYNCLALDRVK